MSARPSLPGRWIWVAMALLLALLAAVRVVVDDPEHRLGLGETFALHARWMVGLAIAVAIALLALVARAHGESGSRRQLDRSFLMLALTWVISSAAVAAMAVTESSTEAVLLRHLAYQVSVAATLNFLRTTISIDTRTERRLIWLQLLLTCGILLWGYLVPAQYETTVLAWRMANLVMYTVVFLVLCRSLLGDFRSPPWLALGASLVGFGVGLSDMAAVDGSAVTVTALHNVFSAYLMMIWLLLTNRLGQLYAVRVERRPSSEHSILGDELADSDLDVLRPVQSLPSHLPAADVVRRRVAQELHDGVGSHLVNVLASLDRELPRERALAEALEQCLLEVKILVDDIDPTQECVLDALARLRYRVQGSLDRLGIRLHWDAHDEEALFLVRDERSRQILRIAQEALANVMRHSRARNVTVSCRYLVEAESLVMDITDDGVGFNTNRSPEDMGKGLQGMHRRARSVEAKLVIRSVPGAGTSLRLVMPIGASFSRDEPTFTSSSAYH